MQRIKELDGLRAIAILLVLGCHYEGFAKLFGGLPEFGWLGVDIFFVLSGYLITTILLGLREQDHAYKTFYSRRAIRILPPYLAATLVVIAIGTVLRDRSVLTPMFLTKQALFLQAFTSSQAKLVIDVVSHPGWYLTHMPSIASYAHNLPRTARGIPLTLDAPASTYWSLSIEEYFYLLWAPVVLRFSRRTIVLLGSAVCAVELLLRWACADKQGYFGLIFRFDALLYGAFLALLLERWRKSPRSRFSPRVFSLGFTMCLVCMGVILAVLRPVVGYEVRQAPLFLALGLPLISAATACLLGLTILRANTNWWFARLLRTGPMQYIGTISYTMYLVHVLAALAVSNSLVRALHVVPTGSIMEAILSSVVTVAIARTSWHFLEKPLLRWKDRRFPGTRVTEPSLN